MDQALYRKYRPRTLNEISGQEHITHTLRNAFKENQLAHAYFFTGPKGTGKTSTARIIAKAANCLSEKEEKPCGVCENCREISEGNFLDLIEIDAASNRGIEESKDLREKVFFPPLKGKYKIYIIDEVHMLTAEAFNALLKTLEEPPAQLIFILCTTESHKVPPTIISRCQRYDFKRASVKDIIERLEQISKQEKAAVETEGLLLIAQNASGGFRDAETLLEQVLVSGKNKDLKKINAETVRKILGLIDLAAVSQLVEYLIALQAREAILHLNRLIDAGFNVLQLTRTLLEYLRFLLLIQNKAGEDLVEVTAEQYTTLEAQAAAIPHEYLVRMMVLFNEAENALKNSHIPQLPLELVIMNLCSSLEKTTHKTEENPGSQPLPKIIPVEPQPIKKEIKVENKQPAPVAELAPQEEKPQVTETEIPSVIADIEQNGMIEINQVMEKWAEILKAVKPRNFAVEACLKASRPIAVEGKFLILEVFYPFHKERIEDKKHRDLVEAILEETFGVNLFLRCVLSEKVEKSDKLLQAAKEIFNGKMIN